MLPLRAQLSEIYIKESIIPELTRTQVDAHPSAPKAECLRRRFARRGGPTKAGATQEPVFDRRPAKARVPIGTLRSSPFLHTKGGPAKAVPFLSTKGSSLGP